MNNIKLPELLAPAGSVESAMAAIEGGADAIYFGADKFSARARAKNLSEGEMAECLRECRARGVKAYGAVNTRLRDAELHDAVETAYEMLSLGTDALIVADLGLAALLRRTFPEASLHASTQITGTSSADARMLEALGFSRMVCPRELSLPEVKTLVEGSPIGIEMFIHGAHCVSVSGQCSMSYVMGGRSGNRGDCAGPCRLPFGASLGSTDGIRRPKDFALSLKDMCLASHIREIIGAGVESLKIEGRLKGPEYTYGVVRVYRELLDGRRDATPEETALLSEYFSRDGFSDGYIRNRYADMLGTKKDSERRRDSERFSVPEMQKVPVTGEVRLRVGERAHFTLRSPVRAVTVTGDVLERAKGSPPSAQSVEKSLSKFGGTPFAMTELSLDTDGICGIAASALNALRRSAVELLLSPKPVVRLESPEGNRGKTQPPQSANRTAILSSADQLTRAVEEYFHEIYIPMADFSDTDTLSDKVGVSLPDVMYEGMTDSVRVALCRSAKEGRRVLVHTLGELLLAVEAGAVPVCSHRFTVYNSGTAAELYRLGGGSVTLSPEISVNAARTVSGTAPTAVVSGGRMPLMLLRRCPMSDGGRRCPHGRAGGFDGKTKASVCIGQLTDRTGAKLPAVGDRYCMTTVYNSVPTWTELDPVSAAAMGIGSLVYIFSAEAPAECDDAVRALQRGAAPAEYRKLR